MSFAASVIELFLRLMPGALGRKLDRRSIDLLRSHPKLAFAALE
jgi:hypothetical protein